MRLFTRKPSVVVGGEHLPIKPLTLENAIRLLLLLAPYLVLIEGRWPEIRRALATTNGQRPALLSTIFRELSDRMREAPGDMTRALGLLLDKDPAWLAGRITATEFVAALPVLDEVNDLTALWEAAGALGIRARYGKHGTD